MRMWKAKRYFTCTCLLHVRGAAILRWRFTDVGEFALYVAVGIY